MTRTTSTTSPSFFLKYTFLKIKSHKDMIKELESKNQSLKSKIDSQKSELDSLRKKLSKLKDPKFNINSSKPFVTFDKNKIKTIQPKSFKFDELTATYKNFVNSHNFLAKRCQQVIYQIEEGKGIDFLENLSESDQEEIFEYEKSLLEKYDTESILKLALLKRVIVVKLQNTIMLKI